MFLNQKQKYCKQCLRKTLHIRDEIRYRTYYLHGALCAATCMLWAIPGALILVGLLSVCSGCGRGDPPEAELKAIEEGARRAVADKLESEFGVSPENAEPSKEEIELKEANDIIERLLPMTKTPPDGIDEPTWKAAMGNLIKDYRRRKDTDGYLPAARWLEAELQDQTPADVTARWGATGGDLPKEGSPKHPRATPPARRGQESC